MNNTPTNLHQSFLLHQRPYRETSIIADFLIESDERVSVVCKGVKSSGKRSLLLRSILQPFGLLALSFKGKSTLKSLRNVESLQPPYRINNKNIYIGLYINEIIVRLFKPGVCHNNIFYEYKKIISSLSNISSNNNIENIILIEIYLRKFEFTLLSILGYELDFFHESKNGEKIKSNRFYKFEVEDGFSEIEDKIFFDKLKKKNESLYVEGEILFYLQQQDYNREDVRIFAKKLTRISLSPHLGPEPILTRELYKNRK